MTVVDLVLRGVLAIAMKDAGADGTVPDVYIVTPSVVGCGECLEHHVAEHEPVLFYLGEDLARGSLNPASIALTERDCSKEGQEKNRFQPPRFAISLRGQSLAIGVARESVQLARCSKEEVDAGKADCAAHILDARAVAGISADAAMLGMIDAGCLQLPATGTCAGRTSALIKVESGSLKSTSFTCGSKEPLKWAFAPVKADKGGARERFVSGEITIRTVLPDNSLPVLGPGKEPLKFRDSTDEKPVVLILDNSPLDTFVPLNACPSDFGFCHGPLMHASLVYQLSSGREHLHGMPIPLFPVELEEGALGVRDPPSTKVCDPKVRYSY